MRRSHLDRASAAVVEQREGLLELLQLVRAEISLRNAPVSGKQRLRTPGVLVVMARGGLSCSGRWGRRGRATGFYKLRALGPQSRYDTEETMLCGWGGLRVLTIVCR